MELDLAASASGPTAMEADVPTSTELDDELLSLLDDKPRHLHAHSRVNSHSQAHAQASTVPHIPESTSRTEKPLSSKESSGKKAAAASSAAPALPSSATPAPSERVVMPPPIAPPNQVAKASAISQASAIKSEKADGPSAPPGSKKKETSAKPAQKSKQPAKPRAKAASAKPKAKAAKDGTAGSSGRLTPSGSGAVAKSRKSTGAAAAAAAKRSVSAAVGQSRSRSASVMPAPPEPASKAQPEEEDEVEEEAIDDKLYCICKTRYDEDKVMIACDRCDEWYHTRCLNMNDLEVDLIDQFVCPICIKANPHLSLKTTYKQRCFAGLKHPRPSSAAACHKPARGAFSKFCSDECGISYMQRRIEGWGGDQAILWASVRDVKQREGVVVKVELAQEDPPAPTRRRQRSVAAMPMVVEKLEVQKPVKTQRERAIERLHAELYKLAPKRENIKQELEIVFWRQRVLELAAARAERLDECGWDQRLCIDDDEYLEYAASVLESYEEGHDPVQAEVSGIEDGVWWCRGKKKCQRHAGWQKLRATEFEFEQELKEKAISALTTQEREIRKQLEDVVSVQIHRPRIPIPRPPVQPPNGHTQSNGAARTKTNGTSQRKGKQKK
ncbi:hypothetical protein BD413DRAFT_600957 [Trametes elegans]|nr:hypothetical protein BD413DRAFT_600957 [Trametes elegans]